MSLQYLTYSFFSWLFCNLTVGAFLKVGFHLFDLDALVSMCLLLRKYGGRLNAVSLRSLQGKDAASVFCSFPGPSCWFLWGAGFVGRGTGLFAHRVMTVCLCQLAVKRALGGVGVQQGCGGQTLEES